ncbi:MAG: hypothetical protein IKI40_08000 [Treponema sp.]|nr:hypothetical protein [Treponema sp.]
MIRFITDSSERKDISRKILESLPEWFEVPENREGSYKNQVNFHFLPLMWMNLRRAFCA